MPAILEAWSPGIEAGPAVADVLFGDVNPSGKLPVSLPRAVGQEPLYYAQLPTGRPATGVDLSRMPTNSQEKFVSRYMDEENSALFPFGWGLSYTRFSFSKPSVSHAEVPVKEAVSSAKEITKRRSRCNQHRKHCRDRGRSTLHSQHFGQPRAAGA